MDDMPTLTRQTTMRHVPGGTFVMGSDRHFRDERPAHKVTVSGFWIDETTVTNADFAAFVAATGYVTVAERPLDPADYRGADPRMLAPGSLVFRMTDGPVDLTDYRNWWAWTPGACWRHPEGPGSEIAGREDHPVVQIACEDAGAYAAWAGKDLPTEAQREFAARGGLDGAEFAWGDELTPDDKHLANTWQGPFPWRNFATDGFTGTCPARSFPANGYGLFEVCGNVWEWTTDWFEARHTPADPDKPSCCAVTDPRVHVAPRAKPASILCNRWSESRAAWSRAARFSELRAIAAASAPPRDTRRWSIAA